MALVTYIGDTSNQDDHRLENTAYGIDFKLGEPVEVTDAKSIAKFKGNRFFEVVEDAQPTEPKRKPDKSSDQG